MASDQLDALWDGWIQTMSESHAATVLALESGNTVGAADEFAKRYAPTIKKLYTETAQTYPVRYEKSPDWCIWNRAFYRQAMKTLNTLKQGDAAAGLSALRDLRQHVHVLHVEASAMKSNDYLHGFEWELIADAPRLDYLRQMREGLEGASAGTRAKADADGYAKAKEAWATVVDGILKKESLEIADVEALRAATTPFYTAYGLAYE